MRSSETEPLIAEPVSSMHRCTAEEKRVDIALQIRQRTSDALASDPGFKSKSLTCLNKARPARSLIKCNCSVQEAVAFAKSGEWVRAISAYDKLFRRVREDNVTHAELYVCYGNRSAAWCAVEDFDQALQDAERCVALAQSALHRYLCFAVGNES